MLALVVTSDGFPLSYEVFDGNRNDVTTLNHIVDTVRQRHGGPPAGCGCSTGDRQRGEPGTAAPAWGLLPVGTPRHRLDEFERELLGGRWETIAQRPGVKVKLIREGDEVFSAGPQRGPGEEGVGHAPAALCAGWPTI